MTKLEKVQEQLARWRTRARWANAKVARLEKQERYYLKVAPVMKAVDEVVKALAPPPPDDNLAIPTFLKRTDSDKAAADALQAEQAARKTAKARGRIAKMKAQKSGETRRMPLTGKAALAFLRDG